MATILEKELISKIKRLPKRKKEELNEIVDLLLTEKRDEWELLTMQEFFKGYSKKDKIYDKL